MIFFKSLSDGFGVGSIHMDSNKDGCGNKFCLFVCLFVCS